MELTQNDGWQLLRVDLSDELVDVRDSHRHLVTTQIETAFRDPRAHFSAIAARCPFPAMAKWLTALVDHGECELLLFR